jgi:hypothetical protein
MSSMSSSSSSMSSMSSSSMSSSSTSSSSMSSSTSSSSMSSSSSRRRCRLAAVAAHLGRPPARCLAAAEEDAGAECASVVHGEALRAFAVGVLTSIGTEPYSADAVADGLVEASLRGVDSHGIRLLPNYIENCLAGGVNPIPRWGVHKAFPSLVVLDADNAFGLAAGRKAMDVGMEVAATQGVCMLAVQNSHHPGAMAATTLYAARRGYLAWGHTNTGPKLQNFGGAGSTFGTNPVAFAAPRGAAAGREAEPPFSLDMATSMIPWNKVEHHRATGDPLPDGVATTAEGVPTVDASETQYLLSAGGYKGFVSCHCSALFSRARVLTCSRSCCVLIPLVHLYAASISFDPCTLHCTPRTHAGPRDDGRNSINSFNGNEMGRRHTANVWAEIRRDEATRRR